MSDLSDALEWADLTDEWWDDGDRDRVRTLAAAARRVAEAPEIGWCVVHDASIQEWAESTPLGPKCWRYAGVQVVEDLPDDPCRMVRKLLVDP